MSRIAQIPTSELVHDYLESYMDIARCELALRYPDSVVNRHADIRQRLEANQGIVYIIVAELAERKDTSLFDERELILGRFST